MNKIVGAILVAYALAAIGFLRAGIIRKRYEELLYIKKIVIMLRGEINYNISVMSETFYKIALRVKEPYVGIFTKLSKKLDDNCGKDFSDLWNEIVINGLTGYIVCDKDLDKLKELGENLGFLDKEMQINYLNMYLDNLEHSIEESRERTKADEKMNKVMGIVAGIFIVIILW